MKKRRVIVFLTVPLWIWRFKGRSRRWHQPPLAYCKVSPGTRTLPPLISPPDPNFPDEPEVQGRRMGIRRLDSRRNALPLLSEERQARSRQSGLESRFPQIRIPGPCLEPDVSNWRHFTTIIRRSEPTLEANRPDCRQTQEHEQNAKRSTQRLKTSTDPHHTDVAANSGFRAGCGRQIPHTPGNCRMLTRRIGSNRKTER